MADSNRLPEIYWTSDLMVEEQSSMHVRDEGEEEDITIPGREKDYEQEGNEQEEGEEGVDEEEEEEDEAYGDDDGYTLLFHGEMDPMKFAEEDASGAQPYEQFERLKCEALAERERKRKRKALDSCSNETGKKPRQEGLFGANIDEIMEAVDFGSRRRSRQPKKRGRKKGSQSKLNPEVMEKLGIANLHYAFGRFDE